MLRRIDLRGAVPTPAELAALLPRAAFDTDAALAAVRPLIEDVRSRGSQALLEQASQFDGVAPERVRVTREELAAALAGLCPQVRAGLELAIGHARACHRAQLPTETVTELIPGGRVRQRWIPVRRVGLYVPGGLAVYPSSVVMNVVAAQVAGVGELAVASPPQAAFGGRVHPTILAACELLGVSEVYAAGGAGAIAMFAYGVADSALLCPAVDVVTGPGNIFVAAAKRAVLGTVGIDAEAGTTEIAILADGSAPAAYVAADMISQAEHDPAAAAVLITPCVELADEVEAEIARQAAGARHRERIETALSGPQSGVIVTSTLPDAVEVANAYAAEHLEVITENAPEVAASIRNAGAIFVGAYSPVPLGDYLAGSNHVLPTGGTARFAQGLAVQAYLKAVQQIEYDAAALARLTPSLVALAECEDLPAHGQAARLRTGR